MFRFGGKGSKPVQLHQSHPDIILLIWPTLQPQSALPLTSASHRSTGVNITAGRPLSLQPQAQALDTNQEPRIKACLDYFKKKGGGGAAVGMGRVEKDRGMLLITCPPVCLSLHFRLQWTYVEATQCDKRVIWRVRRQSLHSHSISGRSQQPSGREKQGGKGHSSLRGDTEVGDKRAERRGWDVEIKECVKRMCHED